MSKYDKLRKNNEEAFKSLYKETSQLRIIAEESKRVSNVAHDAKKIITDLDTQFADVTNLDKVDISFLFLATALQCARQYILTNDKYRIKASEADKAIKDPLKKRVPKEWHEILFGSVPYDAVIRENKESESTGLSGNTHRYRTLGHDPVLGWIFGPINILTDSLTKSDIITTYQVHNNKIGKLYDGGTWESGRNAIHEASENRYNLPAAVIKQAIHFGSDYFTKQGLPVPFVSTVNNELSKVLMTKFNIDCYSITRGASISIFINAIISYIHRLFYDEKKHGSQEMYEVKTRKIIDYSNAIASGSNIIVVAIGTEYGIVSRDPKTIKKSLQKLDAGGIMVTIYRLISDYSFIKKVKEEFLEKEWANIVMGEEYNF